MCFLALCLEGCGSLSPGPGLGSAEEAAKCGERLPICVSWDSVQMFLAKLPAWFLESGRVTWPIVNVPPPHRDGHTQARSVCLCYLLQ